MRRILRTITTKYMMIFMTLIVLTVFVLGTMIATILSNYAIDTKMEDLSTSNILFKSYFRENEEEGDMEEKFKSTEDTLSQILSITFLTTESCEIIVARAAPLTPISNPLMKIGSKIMFITAPIITVTIAYSAFP